MEGKSPVSQSTATDTCLWEPQVRTSRGCLLYCAYLTVDRRETAPQRRLRHKRNPPLVSLPRRFRHQLSLRRDGLQVVLAHMLKHGGRLHMLPVRLVVGASQGVVSAKVVDLCVRRRGDHCADDDRRRLVLCVQLGVGVAGVPVCGVLHGRPLGVLQHDVATG